jgi:hypothetical protein
MVGAAPNTGWLAGLVALDAKSFVRTGANVGADSPFATSQPGIFAVGDIRAGSVKRVASAVGDGPVVVSKVWDFLKAGCNSSRGRTFEARILAEDSPLVHPRKAKALSASENWKVSSCKPSGAISSGLCKRSSLQ